MKAGALSSRSWTHSIDARCNGSIGTRTEKAKVQTGVGPVSDQITIVTEIRSDIAGAPLVVPIVESEFARA
jgi:hypothetical protein